MRRTIEEIEAPMREKGTIGCHCLCVWMHPLRSGVCTGASERTIPMQTPVRTIDVAVCDACAKAMA